MKLIRKLYTYNTILLNCNNNIIHYINYDTITYSVICIMYTVLVITYGERQRPLFRLCFFSEIDSKII